MSINKTREKKPLRENKFKPQVTSKFFSMEAPNVHQTIRSGSYSEDA